MTKEVSNEDREAREVQLSQRGGKLFADLTIGADVAGSNTLLSNSSIASRGVQLIGAGFIVTPEDAVSLGLKESEGLEQVIRDYRNGRDLTQKPRGVKVIDLFGLEADEVRERYPTVYQWVRERVKPERDQNKRDTYRKKWWIFGEARRDWRLMSAGLPRYIATVETTKHRLFTFLDKKILPDNMLVNIAIDDPAVLGVLSSRVHAAWALTAGGRLGMGNDPRYNKTRCFETFPFPMLSDDQAAEIGKLAEQIDTHRKRQQATHDALTLTGIYNILEKLRAGDELSDKEKTIHQQGLVSLLAELHDELDRAVFEAYGWPDLADQLVGRPGATTPLPDKSADQTEAEEELLMRLVALNKQRAAEEAQGKVRWLRPDYQAPEATQVSAELATGQAESSKAAAPAAKGKVSFPKAVPEQLKVLREALAERPHTVESLAELFKHKPRKSVEEGLLSLAAVGRAEHEQESDTWYAIG